MEKDVGSIVPGKLANFTILAENPLTVDPVKIKDIAVWGTVHEGRILPVKKAADATGKISVLGPVLDEPTLAAVNEADRHNHDEGDHSDICMVSQALEAAVYRTK